jgi:bacteriochlorophyllide a dehydrogenase
MQTQAIVITAPQQIELRAVALTEPGPHDVVVQTAFTSISAGTERMLLAGRMPHPMLSFPVVPGYESVGRIVARGAEVSPELLDRWVFVGGARCYAEVNPAWGGQAQTLIVDHSRVVVLNEIAPRHGVLLALGATALHGVDLLDLQPGQRVLVLGQGPVGQIAARLARLQGRYVAVSDRNAERLERAVADETINVEIDPPFRDLAQVKQSFDVIIEATGSMEALADALPLLANGGTILLLGYYDRLELPYMPLFLKQARLLTAREWAAGDPERVRDLLADGSLDVGALLTHAAPIAEFEAAYATALNDPACLKLVIEW